MIGHQCSSPLARGLAGCVTSHMEAYTSQQIHRTIDWVAVKEVGEESSDERLRGLWTDCRCGDESMTSQDLGDE